ncbi:MAG: PDZ domain-containing protein [Blastocatellia bacterium]|nr:PDZ domain-containing protein [Blastocatellia bacterium]
MTVKRMFLLFACLMILTIAGLAQERPLLMQRPTMNRTHIVFSYAGDLWSVPRSGGEAVRLTTGTGIEFDPSFSPDGATIAFTGEYDGNTDVYTVPAGGGVPKRLTWHPMPDSVVGWTPDGKSILFNSPRASFSFYLQLYTIEPDGGFPKEVPLPMAEYGSFSPDGAMIAYEPINQWQPDWKRYKGGQTDRIWIAKLSDSSIEKIPQENSNDRFPIWIGDKVFFLSDRGNANGAWSLWQYDVKSKRVAQAIAPNGFDIKSASAAAGPAPDAIVFEQFGSLGIYDLKSGRTRKVPVTITGDLASVRGKYLKAANWISSGAISATGARAVFETRGEVISVPAEKGDARNLTNTPGVAERDPVWSPDGKWIAWFSDASGEYALHLRDQKGMGEIKKIALEPTFYYSPVWSPDSKKIAFSDKRLNLWYVEIEKGTPVKVATSGADRQLGQTWSPDSRWIAYHSMLKSWTHAIFVYSVEAAKSYQITDGLSDALYPQFDKGGKYLYFTASTDIGPTNGGLDMSTLPVRSTRSVYLAVLRKTDPSPFAPESDEEKVAEEEKKGDADKPAQKPGDKPAEKKEALTVAIDFENIGQRIVALPIPNREFIGLIAGKANTLFLGEGPSLNVNAPPTGPVGATVHKFDLEKRKFDKVLDSVMNFDVSANGEKMLYRQGPGWFIASTAAPPKPGEGRIRTEEMEVFVDPQAEWAQMYREVWRIQRDFFYAPNYHGLDLKATEKRYEPYLTGVAHREDLNYLFRDMLNELTVGHMFIFGGDVPDPKRVPGGLLGADFKVENGRYRFARIYNGENWNPRLRAPLTQPGVNVAVGEYLLAVKGRDLTATGNPYSLFEGAAGKSVVIRVGPNPDGSNSREVTVVPVPNESQLRYLAWVEDNRRKVNELSGGKLAYVHLPDTANGGYTNFNRYYFAQLDRDGAVVDERFNGGGMAAEYIVDFLRKPILNYWAVREGMEATTPFGVIPGPKVMITNEYAGSGGDLMPWMFRHHKVGKLVGKKTWGGLVGIGGYPQLIDGGMVTAPHFAFYNTDGQWEVENAGVAPDIEVEWDPAAWRQGRDLQLEKAVEVALEELKKNPVKRPQRPAYPNYHAPKPAAASGNGTGN